MDFSNIVVPGSTATSSSMAPNSSRREDPAQLKELLLADPHKIALLKQNNPQLADALLNGSLGKNFYVTRFIY